MTCIVGLVENKTVYMGGDSAGVAGYSLSVRADEKVFLNGPCIFGFTSSFRMGQLLRYALKIPDHDPRIEVNKYMVTIFIDSVRECLKNGGFQQTKDGVNVGGCFLVGYQGCLFSVESDYQIGQVHERFMAVGCGTDIALGSLYSTKSVNARKRVTLALEAAEQFNAGVRRPFIIKTMRIKN